MDRRPAPRWLLVTLALVVLLAVAVPASAESIYDETYTESIEHTVKSWFNANSGQARTPNLLYMSENVVTNNTKQVMTRLPSSYITNYGSLPDEGQNWPVEYKRRDNSRHVGYGEYGYFKLKIGSTDYLQITASFDELDAEAVSGDTIITINSLGSPIIYPSDCYRQFWMEEKYIWSSISTDTSGYKCAFGSIVDSSYTLFAGTNYIFIWGNWQNRLSIESEEQGVLNQSTITLQRVFSDGAHPSEFHVKYGNTTVSKTASTDQFLTIPEEFYPFSTHVKSISGSWYNETFFADISDDPTEPPHEPGFTNRTGTVTMTDNNGTTITGFDVTAVNHYTGQEYTVSTDTDVAVMTLPMERTITIRNPQTGEYEDAPVGYYRFYGQAPGYKMLNEGGIQVAVMPEKYRTYQLCDILVTSDSGYLTGKHLFQIRSRSDNTVLQTGTVSAKSATTGNWYNTTVSGGIATLILPYDTSNTQSQYAGNYYVYATSPGYEDSDYGTQIVVMPHTVSEIRYILLTPIGGVPTPGNVTLRIQAFSETGPGVVNAEIFIAGVVGEGSSVWDTYTASSTGYLAVSVPGNSTYDIVASGAGYYDSARRIEVFTEDPPLIEIKLYLSGAPTVEPTTQPTGWPTDQPTTQPTGGIPDEDDDSEGFLMQAVRGIGLAFGVGFATAKLIFGMLLALSIGYATAKQLRGGAAEFGLGLLGGTLLGVLIGLLPVWIIVVLLLVVGLYIGNRYVGGGANNG